MTKTHNFVFIALQVVAWIIFVGLSIEAGALIVNFVFTLFRPEIIQNLYQKLDLTSMYIENKFSFFVLYGFILTVSCLKAGLFYMVIMLMQKMDLSKPFNPQVSKQITNIGYQTLIIGVMSLVAQQIAKNLLHHGYTADKVDRFWADGESFLLMGAIIYIIATIFKKGLEIQNENDLTV